MSYLSNYNKVVLQRNKLLKELEFHKDYMDTLQVWDMQLVRYGCEVIKKRREFIGQLETITREIHRNITGGREELRLIYEPNIQEQEFEKELESKRSRDMRAKATLSGPHRDDLAFVSGDIDIRVFGSQGQQRTAALSLKLAEIELDRSRQKKLLDSIESVQTLLTCTGVDGFVRERFPVNQIFRVSQGSVEEMRTFDT